MMNHHPENEYEIPKDVEAMLRGYIRIAREEEEQQRKLADLEPKKRFLGPIDADFRPPTVIRRIWWKIERSAIWIVTGLLALILWRIW